MTNDSEALTPVFMPALSALLLGAEDRKGEPLSFDEVIEARDAANCIMMELPDARKMEERRGRDLDPENLWHEWQQLRRELGRKPDLDPGPMINQVRSADPEYQQTIRDAHATLAQFREMLPADGSPGLGAMVKTEIREGDNKAFMWLSNACTSGNNFIGTFFEISDAFKCHEVGDDVEIAEADLLDWMVNNKGVLHGGFSIRYYRSTLPAEEREEYDEYIGVVEYAGTRA
jgi:uncharacterized protein YegJ (DUF2314 family)